MNGPECETSLHKEDAMPTETILFLTAIIIAFGAFAGALIFVDLSTKKVRQARHPIPGE